MSEQNYICPLASVDKRLEDVHNSWHKAEKSYFDPDEFRLNIQNAIQSLRTVTFILQKNKAIFPDFDTWYNPWQEKFKSDPLMKWMVDARNKIVKCGDLESKSYIRAEIIASYLNEGIRQEVEANLFSSPEQIIASIPKNQVGDHIRKNGILCIQRRWIENSLPDYELLDAVAIAYGRIAELVHDAHTQLNLHYPAIESDDCEDRYDRHSMGGRLPCMIDHHEVRILNIKIAKGSYVTKQTKQFMAAKNSEKTLKNRYGFIEKHFSETTNNPEETAYNLFKIACELFLIDGYHITMAHLLKGEKVIDRVIWDLQDQSEKYILMRDLANRVIKFGADGAMIIGEMWSAKPDPTNPYKRAYEMDEKIEILGVILVTKSGEPISLASEITRTDSKILLGNIEKTIGATPMMFAPIYEVWGKEIPQEWLKK